MFSSIFSTLIESDRLGLNGSEKNVTNIKFFRIPRYVAETIGLVDLDNFSYFQFIFQTPTGLPSEEPIQPAITLVEEEEIWTKESKSNRMVVKKLSDKNWSVSKRNFVWYDFCKSLGLPAKGQLPSEDDYIAFLNKNEMHHASKIEYFKSLMTATTERFPGMVTNSITICWLYTT